ncbi:MAG: hypothetical protein OHK0011_18730 [Turneriella sp.]
MKKILVFFLLYASLGAQSSSDKKYRGAWFEVKYPADFKVIPSLQSRGMPDEFDRAFFESPDKSVRFYISTLSLRRRCGSSAIETPALLLNDRSFFVGGVIAHTRLAHA